MASMIQQRLGDTMVVVHNAQVPSDSEWQNWMDDCRRISPDRIRVLVFSDGGHPTTVHRNAFTNYIGAARPPIAVVSESLLVRGAATAISWFNDRIRVFGPAQVRAALGHVGLDLVEGVQALRVARDLASRLEGGAPRALVSATEQVGRIAGPPP